MFGTLLKSVSMFKEKVSQEIGDRMGLSESYGALWEPSENVEYCRGCGAKFQLPLLKRKHHCRICAGVFCDSCCVLPVDSVGVIFAGNQKKNAEKKSQSDNPNGEETSIATMRICDGCKRGEVPGERLRNAVRALLEAAPPKQRRESRLEKEKKKMQAEEEASTANALERLSMLVAVRMGENVGVVFTETPPAESVYLTRGSAFGEDGNPVLTGKAIPSRGYFEIVNKSKEFCCVKVLRKGGQQMFEIPRPSYLAVPPGGSLHAFFNEHEVIDDVRNILEIIILHSNPNAIPENTSRINFDTTLLASAKIITPCARVELFKCANYYTVSSKNSNVLLKYKGNGVADLRLGNSMSRVGFGGVVQGLRCAKNKLDFATNVSMIDSAFVVNT